MKVTVKALPIKMGDAYVAHLKYINHRLYVTLPDLPVYKYEFIESTDKIIQFLGKRLIIPCHLYFLSQTQEVMAGDWFIANEGVHKCIRREEKGRYPIICLENVKVTGHFHTWKPIVATTNPTLGLPLIPEIFVRDFVKKQGKITNYRGNLAIDKNTVLMLDLDDADESAVQEEEEEGGVIGLIDAVKDFRNDHPELNIAPPKYYTEEQLEEKIKHRLKEAIESAYKALKIEKTNNDGDFVSIEYINRFLNFKGDYWYFTMPEIEKMCHEAYIAGMKQGGTGGERETFVEWWDKKKDSL